MAIIQSGDSVTLAVVKPPNTPATAADPAYVVAISPGTPVSVGVGQGTTTTGQTGLLMQGAATTSAPSYVNGTTDPLSLTLAGDLRTVAKMQDGSGNPITSTSGALDVNITSGVTLDVNLDNATDDVLVYGFDGTSNQKIKTNVDGSVSVNDNGGSLTVDAVNLDIRDLSHTQDSVKIGDGTDFLAVNADGSINATLVGTTTVDLSASSLAALENITVQNPGGAGAVNIQDGGNSITVDATDLDIRDLVFATDKVDVSGSSVKLQDGSGTPITSTSNALDVNIKSGVTLEVNLDNANDDVLIYGFDGTSNQKVKTAVDGSVSINDGGNSITVDAVSLPLPTGAATSANQATEITSLSSIDTKLTTTNSSLSSIDAGIPAALGQTTMANSMPVVFASDQSAIPTSTVANTASGSITSIQNVTVNSNGKSTALINVTGTWTGALEFEGRINSGPWEPSSAANIFLNDGQFYQPVTSNGLFQANVAGFTEYRLRGNSVTSGSASVELSAVDAASVITAISGYVFVKQPSGDTWAISAASLPLPTGAATSANQTAVIGSASGGTAAASSELVGGVFNTVLPTLTNGQQSALQLDSSGRLIIAPTTQGSLAEDHNFGTVGANTLRTAAQIGNATGAANFGAGTTTAQTLRVVLPTDQTAIPASQSGIWTSRLQDGSGTAITSTGGALDVNIKSDTIQLDTEIPAAAALADATANPTTPLLGAAMEMFNGTTWDRVRGTIANGLLADVSRIVAALPTGTNSIGQVTANAGTNLNTSLLALESGGNLASIKTNTDNLNLAQASTTSGQKGNLILSATTTAAPTYTTATSNPLSTTTAGDLRTVAKMQDGSGTNITSTGGSLNVNVTGGSGSQQYADGAARGTATGTLAMGDDGTNIQSISVDTTGKLNINNISGTVSLPTGAATSANQTNGSQRTKLTDGTNDVSVKAGAAAATSGDNSLVVTVHPSTNAMPITAASLPLPTGAATAANQTTLGSQTTKINDGTTTAGVTLTNNLKTSDILGSSGTQGNLAVGTSAVEVKVGAGRLTNRKLVTVQAFDADMYWGYTSGVTTSTGSKIALGGERSWNASDATTIYLICGSSGKNARITEST